MPAQARRYFVSRIKDGRVQIPNSSPGNALIHLASTYFRKILLADQQETLFPRYAVRGTTRRANFHDHCATLTFVLRALDFFIASSAYSPAGKMNIYYKVFWMAYGGSRKFTILPPQLPTYKLTNLQYDWASVCSRKCIADETVS